MSILRIFIFVLLAESREIPGLMLMFLPSPHHPQPERLQEMLLRFQDTEAGRQFTETLAMEGLRRSTMREMKAMDVFLPKLGQQLNH